MEERKKRRKLSNSRCSAGTEGPQQQPQKRSQQGGSLPLRTDKTHEGTMHTGSSYGRAGAKKPANHSHLRKSLLIPQICPQSKQNAPDYKSF